MCRAEKEVVDEPTMRLPKVGADEVHEYFVVDNTRGCSETMSNNLRS